MGNELADLERIIDADLTKADKARALFDLGCTRSEVVELLSMAYSQAHSIWKKGDYANGSERGRSSPRNALQPRHPGDGKPSVGKRSDTDSRTSRGPSRRKVRSTLHLSPTQTRYITQDGHVAVKVEKEGGRVVCRNCGKDLAFTIKWLGFVHKDSTSKPTDIEDRYD